MQLFSAYLFKFIEQFSYVHDLVVFFEGALNLFYFFVTFQAASPKVGHHENIGPIADNYIFVASCENFENK